jgi:hypothetical protein
MIGPLKKIAFCDAKSGTRKKYYTTTVNRFAARVMPV